jgi:hypothetical protein
MSNEEEFDSGRAHQHRGRPFQKGNPGRPPGSKNRATLIASTLLEEDAEKLLQVALKLALDGDKDMLKFLLGRLLPKERTVRLDLQPIITTADAIEALAHVTGAVANGEISPSEGAAVGSLLTSYSRTIEIEDIDLRLDQLEHQLRFDHAEQDETPPRTA